MKYLFKQERLDFSINWLAKEEDYLIGEKVTEAAIYELLLGNKAHELLEMLRDMPLEDEPEGPAALSSS